LHEVQFDLLCNDVIRKDDEQDGEIAQVLPDNVESGSDLIDMVFRKDRVEDRKLWLSHVRKDIFLDFTTISKNGLRYSDFINKEYILFSNYDNDRSIPHMMDGLKPSQRKVLFGCFKRKLYKNEIKVAQLVGYVAEHSAYHHGEASLQGTIVSMAQNFVGSNNINLLTPSGQFGTRRMGGSDAASPRYIFTKVESIARAIFHPDDDDLLNYLNDDGSSIEPEFYVPVIPMSLCNGAEGIGTGWSSKICNYSPREIIANLRRKIRGEEMVPMAPYFCGFTGRIEEDKKGKYTTYGKIDRLDDTTLAITELPIKKWTQTYKEFLEAMLVGDSKTPPDLKDMKENHTETTVSFTLSAAKEKIDDWEKEPKGGLYAKFKLTSSLSTTNMTLFDQEARITRYESPEDIIDAFYTVRLEFYDKRKQNLVRNLEAEKMMLSNKARFVEEVCAGVLVVSNRKRVDILEELRERGYDLIDKSAQRVSKTSSLEDDTSDEEEEEETSTTSLAKGYEYLLGMKIWSLTYEKAQQLRSELETKSSELDELQATDPTEIWERDLVAVEQALDERDAALYAAEVDERKAQKKNIARVAKKAKKSKKDEWDSSMESDEDMSLDASDDDGLVVTKQKSKVPAKPRALVAARKAPPVVPTVARTLTKNERAPSPPPVESDDELGFGESLRDRMQKKLLISPPAKSNKRVSPRMDDVVVIDSDDDLKPRPVKAAKKPLVKSKAVGKSESLNVKKKPMKAKAGKKAYLDDSDSNEDVKGHSSTKAATFADSDDDMDFPSGDDFPSIPARARPARAGATKKTTKYTFDSDSEDVDIDESE
jgi:DNA gyrase/topoisomerase IV subunit A